jgi:hypothetical protein
MATKATYQGDGTEYLNGVPARDLSDEDWAALDDEHQAAVAASPLYEVAAAKGTPAPTRGATPAESPPAS